MPDSVNRIVVKSHACIVDWRKTVPDWAPYSIFKARPKSELEVVLAEWMEANVEGGWSRGGGEVEMFRFERRDERDRFKEHWE